MRNYQKKWVYLCLAVLLVWLGYHTYQAMPSKIQTALMRPLGQFEEITVLSQPRFLPKSLMQALGNTAMFDPQHKQWTWFFFGFTRCEQLCPTTLQQMHETYAQLKKMHLKTLPRIWMISIDPERETQATVEAYIQKFDPSFHGLVLDKLNLEQLTHSLGMFYDKIFLNANNVKDKKNYTLNHSGTIVILNPEGAVAGFFNMPHNSNKMAAEYSRWVRQ